VESMGVTTDSPARYDTRITAPPLTCRTCGASTRPFLDLGASPLSNAFLRAGQLSQVEPFYPLTVYICPGCFLVQLPRTELPARIFADDYAYFSSYSDSWLAHARKYCTEMTPRLGLTARSHVVEIASNDGYLLQYFLADGLRVLGIEPAANVAEVARGKGIETLTMFFGAETARQIAEARGAADLLVGNNVLAHVPDINDFVEGLRILLAPGGTITMEFPHVLQLILQNQFDTIYHEHFSYLSLAGVQRVFREYGLALVDVEELPTHGGSLRIFAQHSGAGNVSPRVEEIVQKERAFGLERLDTYEAFASRVQGVKRKLLSFLIRAKEEGARVAGYGAPAKGNTLLNYCGVRSDLVEYTVDRNPHKQGLYLPGTRIPVYAPDRIRQTMPDYLLILPWNLRDEVMEQMAGIRAWGGQFVVPIPHVKVYP